MFDNAPKTTALKSGMVTVVCANKQCKKSFEARKADRQRGWGKFCSKSCKAIRQIATHGDTRQYAPNVSWERAREDQREYGGTPQYDRQGNYEGFTMSPSELAHGGYGDADENTTFGDGKW